MRTDWALFGAILGLLAFGLVLVYSASSVVAETLFDLETWRFAYRQAIAAVIGLACLFAFKLIDYRSLRRPVWVFGSLSLLIPLLIAAIVLDPKAHRWIRLAGGQFQPSEIAKPVLVLFLAYFVARREGSINSRHTLGPAAIVVAFLVGLIGYGDLGTALILLAPAAAVFFVAGLERRYLYISAVLAVVLAAGAIYQKPYRILRMLAFAGITEEMIEKSPRLQFLAPLVAESKAARDANHQPYQAKLALGEGGVLGVGLGQGNQKMGFLPEAHTDYIYGVVGNELGLAGCVSLAALYLVVFWRGLRVYFLAPDVFGRYLALGVVTAIAAQALFNMSVVAGMLPAKGIPLPLVSFGGSSMIMTLTMLGLLLSVSDRA